MSVQVRCPNCAAVVELHRPPVTECARCHVSYPPTVQRNAEEALRHTQAPKPTLLLLGQWFSLLAGAMFLLLLVLAPFDLATYSISGEQVSGPEFLRRVGLGFGLLTAIQLAIAIGLLRDRAWARPLMMYYWLAAFAVGLSASGWEMSSFLAYAFSCAIPAAVAGWYLYGKENVVAYFAGRGRS